MLSLFYLLDIKIYFAFNVNCVDSFWRIYETKKISKLFLLVRAS